VDDADARAVALNASASDALLLGGAAAAAPAGALGLTQALIPPEPSAAAVLSRELVASWADQYAPALALLKRVFPPGLVRCLNAPQAPPASAGQGSSGVEGGGGAAVSAGGRAGAAGNAPTGGLLWPAGQQMGPAAHVPAGVCARVCVFVCVCARLHVVMRMFFLRFILCM